MVTVGFAGLGLMGEPMARRLAGAAIGELRVLTRADAPAQRLVAEGATRARDVTDLVPCHVVLTMLPDLPETARLLHPLVDAWAVTPAAYERAIVVMSSVSPDAVREFGHRVRESTAGSVAVIDAPVSGGVQGATDGTLSIMVGSTPAQLKRLRSVFDAMGTTVLRMGELGAGSVAKACNQLVVAATAQALGEAVVVASRAGIDATDLLDLLDGGLAASRLLADKRDKLLNTDYSTSGAASHMLRNLQAYLASADAGAVDAPLGHSLSAIFSDLVQRGLGDLDLIATRAAVEQRSGLPTPGVPAAVQHVSRTTVETS